ncbi:MAG: AhpC/TSA family protein [Proteobacteria bacterium]|nr:AhpC/TSA family protein [Pseudomonadota bacterium]
MLLNTQLSELKTQKSAMFSNEIKETMASSLKGLMESGLVEKAPKVGEQLKPFVLPNQNGEERNLQDLRKNGPLVVTFYRGGWCPYCNLELRAYQKNLAEINATGARLIAITPELPDSSLSTIEKNELEYEVLTDSNADYARSLGLVFTLSNDVLKLYDSFGIDVAKHNGDGQFDIPFAATFVVDMEGKITFSFVDEDYTKRAEPGEVLYTLESLIN